MELDLSLLQVINVLKNQQHIAPKKHISFLKTQAENILFLLSRVVCFEAQTRPILEEAVDYVISLDMFDLHEPTILIALEQISNKQEKLCGIISGYPSEFPEYVLNKNFQTATSVMVATALAVWSFYHNPKKLAQVVNIGLKRFLNTSSQARLLQFNNQRIKPECESFLYFVTHIILIATMYGQLHSLVGGTAKQWQEVEQYVVNCVQELHNVADKNLEVWLELLFCLKLLGNKHKLKLFEQTIKLFKPNAIYKNQHKTYHTFVLWAYFFSFVIK